MNKQTKILLILFVICFGLGVAIVGVGALAKLQHWSWAGDWIIIGMVIHIASYLLGAILLVNTIRKQ